ncbi:amidase [Bradyrhizobium sp. BR 10289]|uniref:amidase n=1 Tax=Bradyrhizobium sp. BR 10289 TaxID=2749993 RepID=UPI001C64BC2C|nr:amidase [Bradyrhizobium sp. BR 10289]MBW7970131.1 amidase [Bradyrhizobium sp. BR 10289]
MTSLPGDLWKWDGVDLAKGIRTGLISSVEAVDSCLRRMSEVNGKLNAVVVDLSEQARSDAKAADDAVLRGEELGPLHGVPITIKLNADVAGQATSNGVVAFKNNIAEADGPPARNLRRAGAIFIGRTNVPEFSMRGDTVNDLFGRTRNPWSEKCTAGGSSGGAASSVAAGITPIAHGTDLGGSIVQPAFCNGITGLRPSAGRVAGFSAPRPASADFMAAHGPLARSVRDVRIAFEALIGPDPRDPWWTPAPVKGPDLQRPLKVAMCIDPGHGGLHADVEEGLREAAARLRKAGYVVDEVNELPNFADAVHAWRVLQRSEGRFFFLPNVRKYGGEDIKRIAEAGVGRQPAPDLEAYVMALSNRTTYQRNWAMFMQEYPLILCPVLTTRVPETDWDLKNPEERAASLPTTLAVPLLGLPALSVPIWARSGLPIGVQLVAQRFREDILLDAGEVVEAGAPKMTPLDPQF